ncbi:hypothetical protein [Streptomyces spororaveus]|uniref:hypothetical protein n=1 Tax=Streptomyces spororaveus TaxID=284039 RepID=UPI0037A6B839
MTDVVRGVDVPVASVFAPPVFARAIDEVLASFTVEVCPPNIEAAEDRAASGVEEYQAVLPRLVEAYSEAEVEAAGEIGADRVFASTWIGEYARRGAFFCFHRNGRWRAPPTLPPRILPARASIITSSGSMHSPLSIEMTNIEPAPRD